MAAAGKPIVRFGIISDIQYGRCWLFLPRSEIRSKHSCSTNVVVHSHWCPHATDWMTVLAPCLACNHIDSKHP